MRIAKEKGRSRSYLVGLLGASALVLAGCNGSEDDSSAAADIQYNSPAAIAQVSADNYHDNENGIITAATLKRWKDDWINERPAGITGKLVILQVTEGPTGYTYIAPNNTAVYTYLVDDWVRTRSNGVVSTVSMVLDGPSIDGLLQTYNIDPAKDMIVCAQGAGSAGNAMAQGRCWYTFRYWGVDAKHLALLNGDNDSLATEPAAPSGHRNDGVVMGATDFAAAASKTPTTPGSFSVKSLKDDNTMLQATLEDMLNILPSTDRNELNDGVFIWDARSDTQYSGGVSTTDGGGVFQNNGSRQGHPYGALQLNFTNLLEMADGSFRYKEKAVLASYLNGEVDGNGKGFRDSSYQHVGAGSAYQDGDTIYTYCETTYRAMITGIASAVVLGKPTRFYDGAMTEWNSMSYLQDATGNYILPIDSPWRTDIKSYYVEAATADVAPRVIDDAYAGSANAIVREDRAYKVTDDNADASGGSAPVANGCG